MADVAGSSSTGKNQDDQKVPLGETTTEGAKQESSNRHDPTASNHPSNCECLLLRPGLFLPPSLKLNEPRETDMEEDEKV